MFDLNQAIGQEIRKLISRGPVSQVIANTPLTPRVKRVLWLAAEEARSQHHICLEPKYLLLGLLREGDGVASRALKNLGVGPEQIRRSLR